MPEQIRAGVGLRSMRERAEELGGGVRLSRCRRVAHWLTAGGLSWEEL